MLFSFAIVHARSSPPTFFHPLTVVLHVKEGGFDTKNTDSTSNLTLKPSDTGDFIQDGKETDKRNGVRARNRLYVTLPPFLLAIFVMILVGEPSKYIINEFTGSYSRWICAFLKYIFSHSFL